MSRARTNWQRLQNVRTHVARYQAGFESLQRWEHPVVSIAAIVGTTLLSFYPHAVLACLLLYTMLHSLLIYRCPSFCRIVMPQLTEVHAPIAG